MNDSTKYIKTWTIPHLLTNLLQLINKIGERLSVEEITEIVKRACTDENAMEITLEDFYNVMTKKTFPWVNYCYDEKKKPLPWVNYFIWAEIYI